MAMKTFQGDYSQWFIDNQQLLCSLQHAVINLIKMDKGLFRKSFLFHFISRHSIKIILKGSFENTIVCKWHLIVIAGR